MKRKARKISTFTTFVIAGICVLCLSLTPAGITQDKTGYTGAEKILVPHRSWPCGMSDGIPVPERGVPVFEADLKLDQAYDVGRTQYGQRDVFIIQGGTVSGEKIHASVMSGGLDFQLSFSGGMEIEQILVLQTDDGKYLYMRNAGTAADRNDVRIVPDFEAPNAGDYNWLNTGAILLKYSL